MSRTVRHRWVLSGTLVAESAVHVGGIGEGAATSLGAARDGRDRPLLPGTSLTGAIRAALGTLDPAEERLWGRISGRLARGGDDGTGEASWIWVADATASEDTVPEVRESVSIDRIHGVAARGHLFTREVLPIGTRFSFDMRVDDAELAGHDGTPSAAERLVHRIAGLLRGSSFTVGAATTRGLGRVRLRHATLRRLCLHDRAGMIATLRGTGTGIPLPEPAPGELPARMLRVTVPWRPHGPLMVQVGVEGDVVDAFPLTARTGTAVRLLLPGSSIKGAFRAHAERILRTVRGSQAEEGFLEQMKAEGLEPVGALFGTAGEEQAQRGGGRRGALTARECLGEVELPIELWEDVRLLQRRIADRPEVANGGGHDDKDGTQETAQKRAALKRLHDAVTELNGTADGVGFAITPHNAVDRWTGGAADGLLFATLEPHAYAREAWQPIVLEVDTEWLGGKLHAALALLLFLLRDLCDGWIAFGHGTTRGMGAVRVDPAEVAFAAGATVPLHAELHGRSLAELLGDAALIRLLDRAWNETGDTLAVHAPAVSVGACTAEQALAAFAANEPGFQTVGFAYSSSVAPWFRLDAAGTPRDSGGAALDLTGVFELRAFDANRELRWWHTSGGLGQARELTDEAIGFPGAWSWRSYRRLLWGTVTVTELGWASLFEARIGSLEVPVLAPVGSHVWLEAVEYVAEDDDGNVAVIDERLTGLVVEVTGR